MDISVSNPGSVETQWQRAKPRLLSTKTALVRPGTQNVPFPDENTIDFDFASFDDVLTSGRHRASDLCRIGAGSPARMEWAGRNAPGPLTPTYFRAK